MKKIANSDSCRVNGIEISYEDSGGDGPVLVFVHGVLNSGEMWRPQLEYFSPRCRVITYDLRGHGESEIGSTDFSVELLAEDLLHLLDHLDTGPAVICGFSLGGCIAQVLAAQYPDSLSALIISDSFQGRRRRGALPSGGKRVLGLTFGILPAKQMVSLLHLPLKSMNHSVRQDLLGIAQANLSNLSGGKLAEIVSALADFEYQDLSRFEKPTQVMVGANEPRFLRKQARALHGDLPNAELKVIPDAQHGPNLENTEVFNATIDGLLARL